MSGRVWAHVGQPFGAARYDVVVVGAGRMGAACAHYLRALAPERSLLLVEESGIPNEDGATLSAPGVWSTLDLAPAEHARAQWVRGELAALGETIRLRNRPVVELSALDGPGYVRAREAAALDAGLGALARLDALPYARLDVGGVSYRPGLLAQACAGAAVQGGADLLLNTRAQPRPGGVRLERLTVTNTHEVVVHERHEVEAGVLVIAAGSAGPTLAEQELGAHTAHGHAYRQFPRLELPSTPQSAVVRVDGLTLRPQQGGYTLVPALRWRDPHGYAPTGGRLTGVPTGLRREVLEDLVALMDAVPALASGALHTGRSLREVPGAWFALPYGHPAGLPMHQEVAPSAHLLLGGPQADTLGLGAAYDLAATLSGRAERPWHRAATGTPG